MIENKKIIIIVLIGIIIFLMIYLGYMVGYINGSNYMGGLFDIHLEVMRISQNMNCTVGPLRAIQ